MHQLVEEIVLFLKPLNDSDDESELHLVLVKVTHCQVQPANINRIDIILVRLRLVMRFILLTAHTIAWISSRASVPLRGAIEVQHYQGKRIACDGLGAGLHDQFLYI